MRKDSKPKESIKAKGKSTASNECADTREKDKGRKGGADGLDICTYVKARHIPCEKQEKMNQTSKKWPPAELAKVAAEYSEYLPRKKRGSLQEVEFSTSVGACSATSKSTYGYHIILAEDK
ncbi:hypothetical protein KP509_03G040400 [Ceratopteris richardii]|uniref:peptidylprolyl isomerase n=1 Tax=Ceratopteris richardii TaxID=49495 RepID=A0A8T2V2T6_CERRI|nr:hypothetical protein KP509_03G040400 [Ceratopteris richardii]